MGLTIKYKITAKSKKQALEGLEKLRQRCLDLPFEEVGEVKNKEITKEIKEYWDQLQKKCFCPNNSDENLKERDRLIEAKGFTTWELIKADERIGQIIALNIWPGEGCEPCDIQFFVEKGKKIISKDFCKTQYSVHFVRHHLLVCSMLDIAKEVGFKVEVDDEGEYFETRDVEILAKNLQAYNGLVLKIGESIKKAFGAENVESPIDKNQSMIIIKNKKILPVQKKIKT
jgi:hypothetical protein